MENVFERYSVNKLIFMFSTPAIFSLMLESLTSVIDTAFAGRLGEMSENAISAMGVLNPLISMLIAAQLVFGVSTSIMIAKGKGEKNEERINNSFKVGYYSSIMLSSFISLIIYLFHEKLLTIIGANGIVRELAKDYLLIALITNVFSSVGYTLVNNVRAFGYPKMEMFITFTATIINISLNVLFTFKLDMGLVGIGLATLISEIYYAVLSGGFLLHKKLWFKKSKLRVEQYRETLTSLVKIGFVQFFIQSLSSIGGFIFNRTILYYSNISYVGVWSIAQKTHSVLILPLVGLTQGIQSVIAYYDGSNNDKRKQEVVKKSILYSLIYGVFITIIIIGFTDFVARLFTTDNSLIVQSNPVIKVSFIAFPLMGIIYTFISLMQISNREVEAMTIGFLRQIGILIPLVILLPWIFSRTNILGIEPKFSIFFALPISDIIVTIIAVILNKQNSIKSK